MTIISNSAISRIIGQVRYLFTILLVVTFTPVTAGWVSDRAAIMGTEVAVELWHDDTAQGRALIASVFDEMRRIDRLMSTHRADSELSRINATAAGAPVETTCELFDLVELALNYSIKTGGAFDITYASAGRYYDYRAGTRPDKEKLQSALPAIDYRHVELDPARVAIQYRHPGVYIDLGGIAKGHAVDRAIAVLRAAGIEHATVSAGGDSRVLGRHQDRPWQIGIRNPRADGIITMIPLEDAAISTSGDYERFFKQDGIRYHHILDPATGDSAREIRSASVIGASATHTDALSTSVFVLGVQQGLALINRLPDTEAVIIDRQGLLHYSDGLARATTE